MVYFGKGHESGFDADPLEVRARKVLAEFTFTPLDGSKGCNSEEAGRVLDFYLAKAELSKQLAERSEHLKRRKRYLRRHAAAIKIAGEYEEIRERTIHSKDL